jgi:hypothetical protein
VQRSTWFFGVKSKVSGRSEITDRLVIFLAARLKVSVGKVIKALS